MGFDIKRFATVWMVLVMVVGLASCAKLETRDEPEATRKPSYVIEEILATNLMEGIGANEVEGKTPDDRFIVNTARFSIDLFKRSAREGNSMISPLSVLIALAMTANGADKSTLEQMEKVLGGDMSIEEINEYLYSYANSLPNSEKSKLVMSNSIWFRDEEKRLLVEKSFLQKNADYYNADVYKSPFDDQTVKDINNWVAQKTDGMIDEIVKNIDDAAIMFLLNAIVFDAEWENIYNIYNIYSGEFRNIDGSKASVDMMTSEETKYIKDNKARGFIKPYKNGDYSFVTILPDEGISVNDYVSAMSGESFLSLLEGAENKPVQATLPKFSYDYTIKMNDILKDMGIVDAFEVDAADFSRLGRSTRGNIFISEVLHKTFISVDEKGTRAGAVTKVEMQDESEFMGEIVILDRPFIYAIVDNATNIPVFIGTVIDLGK